jgi:hypothetical protein
MSRWRSLLFFVGVALNGGCQRDTVTRSTTPTAVVTPPNLSSPCRFQPMIAEFVASPAKVRLGERVALTAQLAAAPSWSLSIEAGSTGDGTFDPAGGIGTPLRSEFDARRAGNVVVLATALNVECGFSTVAKVTLAVER